MEVQAEYFPPKEDIMLQNEGAADIYIIVSGAVVSFLSPLRVSNKIWTSLFSKLITLFMLPYLQNLITTVNGNEQVKASWSYIARISDITKVSTQITNNDLVIWISGVQKSWRRRHVWGSWCSVWHTPAIYLPHSFPVTALENKQDKTNRDNSRTQGRQQYSNEQSISGTVSFC